MFSLRKTNSVFPYLVLLVLVVVSSVVGQKLVLLLGLNGLWVLALNCLSGIKPSYLMSLKQSEQTHVDDVFVSRNSSEYGELYSLMV